MNKLAKRGAPDLWGEDRHAALVAAKDAGDAALVAQTEQRILRDYRLQIRHKFESDAAVAEALKDASPAAAEFDRIRGLVADLARPESEQLFNAALRELLAELDEMRSRPGSVYLVETDTGKATIQIRPEHLYQPPDFVGEDGKVHKSGLILHPGVSASIIQKRYQEARVADAIERGGQRAALAMEHLRDPDAVRIRAVQVLEELGIKTDLEAPARYVELEFGKEHVEGPLQSPNPGFHRAYVFGGQLARRVRDELSGAKSCRLERVEMKVGAKRRWYLAKVGLPA